MNLATRLLRLRRLGVVCVGLTVLLMALGAWVKANGAGLACPDWPQCYGEWLPPFPSAGNGGTWEGEPVTYTQDLILYEWTHRFVVSVLLVPLVAFAWLAARGRELSTPLRQLPAMGLSLYLFQAGLGAITVMTGNPAWATTAHLVTAVTFLLVLTVAACYAYLRPLPLDAPVAPGPAPERRIEYVYPDEPQPAAAPGAGGPDGH